jgi:hypothetical protein
VGIAAADDQPLTRVVCGLKQRLLVAGKDRHDRARAPATSTSTPPERSTRSLPHT